MEGLASPPSLPPDPEASLTVPAANTVCDLAGGLAAGMAPLSTPTHTINDVPFKSVALEVKSLEVRRDLGTCSGSLYLDKLWADASVPFEHSCSGLPIRSWGARYQLFLMGIELGDIGTGNLETRVSA